MNIIYVAPDSRAYFRLIFAMLRGSQYLEKCGVAKQSSRFTVYSVSLAMLIGEVRPSAPSKSKVLVFLSTLRSHIRRHDHNPSKFVAS